jgi:hypothetical protein
MHLTDNESGSDTPFIEIHLPELPQKHIPSIQTKMKIRGQKPPPANLNYAIKTHNRKDASPPIVFDRFAHSITSNNPGDRELNDHH